MVLNRQAALFNVTIRCLLSLWLFLGCVVMLEQLQIAPETGVENQTGLDPDEAVLSELVSEFKSGVLLAGDHSSVMMASGEPTLSVSFATFDPFTRQSLDPPSLRLY